MGTSSTLFLEKEDGDYIGVYCHYDGYPDHMLKQIKFCSHEQLYDHIVVAGTHGGYRLFSPETDESEFLSDDTPDYAYDPEADGVDYIYIKCLDGSIKWRKRMRTAWTTYV